MKKYVFTAITALWLILTPWLPVRAAAVFFVKDAQAKAGDLIRAEVCVQSDIVPGAAMFEFRFDDSKAEFRDVEPSQDAEVCVKSEGNRITVSYLNSGETVQELLFSLVFRSKEAGDVSLECSVCDCADCEAAWMDVQAVNVGCLSVRSAASAAEGTSALKSRTSDTDTASSVHGKSKTDKAKADVTVPSVRDGGTNHSKQDDIDSKRTAAVIVLHVAAVISLITVIFLIRKIKQKKREDNSDETDGTEEKDE